MEKLSRKKIEKKMRSISGDINKILAGATKDKTLPAEQIKKVNQLISELETLRFTLKPRVDVPSNYRDTALMDLEKQLRIQSGLEQKVCASCGEPFHNNKKNGKPWCICNRPFKAVDKNQAPERKIRPPKWITRQEDKKLFEEQVDEFQKYQKSLIAHKQ